MNISQSSYPPKTQNDMRFTRENNCETSQLAEPDAKFAHQHGKCDDFSIRLQIGLRCEADVSFARWKRGLVESLGKFFRRCLVREGGNDHAALALSPVCWGGNTVVGCELQGIHYSQNLWQCQ